MSHFAKYQVKVSNIEFIKKALIEMGYTYKENTKVNTNFGESRPARLVVVRNGNPLSIGFCPNANGELELIADWWGTRIPANEFTTKLSQLHSKYQILEVCEENRWEIEEDTLQFNDAGDLEIYATQFV